MRRAVVVVILCVAALAQTAASQVRSHGRARVRAKARSVTVSGCVRQGVECLVLEALEGGKKYSVAPNRRLEVGWPYRVTGTISDMGFCMEGHPILRPRKIYPIKARCPK